MGHPVYYNVTCYDCKSNTNTHIFYIICWYAYQHELAIITSSEGLCPGCVTSESPLRKWPPWAWCLQMLSAPHRTGRYAYRWDVTGEAAVRSPSGAAICLSSLCTRIGSLLCPAPAATIQSSESGLLSSSDIEETFGQLMNITEKQERVHDGGFVLSWIWMARSGMAEYKAKLIQLTAHRLSTFIFPSFFSRNRTLHIILLLHKLLIFV